MRAALRVLHVPDSVGGHAPGLARAERALGLESVCVVLAESPFRYDVDEVLKRPGDTRLRFERRRLRLLARAAREFDVVHFNFGRTLLPAYLPPLDLALLRALGKAVFVTFQGDDARQGGSSGFRQGADSLAAQLPHLYLPAADRWKRRRIGWFDRFADGIFYLNPDLARVLPDRAAFVPYAHVEPRQWHWRPGPREEPPLVVHAPSDPEVKGTAAIVGALSALVEEGVSLRWQLVQGLPHVETRQLFEGASLGVDQLYAGWYGGVAVEWMALGVPVASRIRVEDLETIPAEMRDELPVVPIDGTNLGSVIRRLIESPRERAELGRRGRSYVERWHDPQVIAGRLRRIYEAAVRRRGFGDRRPARAGESGPRSGT